MRILPDVSPWDWPWRPSGKDCRFYTIWNDAIRMPGPWNAVPSALASISGRVKPKARCKQNRHIDKIPDNR